MWDLLLAVAFSLSDSICKVQSVGASQLVISHFKPCLSPDSLTHFLQPAKKKTWQRRLSRAPYWRNCSPMLCDNAPTRGTPFYRNMKYVLPSPGVFLVEETAKLLQSPRVLILVKIYSCTSRRTIRTKSIRYDYSL
jgi:hypothetical protein